MTKPSRYYTEPPYRARKTVTYAAGAAGLQGAITDIFTVTGKVIIAYIVPYCVTSLTEDAGTPTLQLGVTGLTNQFCAPTTATGINTGEFWVNDTPQARAVAIPAGLMDTATDQNIVCEVGGTNNIDAGVIEFTVYWWPLSNDGKVEAA